MSIKVAPLRDAAAGPVPGDAVALSSQFKQRVEARHLHSADSDRSPAPAPRIDPPRLERDEPGREDGDDRRTAQRDPRTSDVAVVVAPADVEPPAQPLPSIGVVGGPTAAPDTAAPAPGEAPEAAHPGPLRPGQSAAAPGLHKKPVGTPANPAASTTPAVPAAPGAAVTPPAPPPAAVPVPATTGGLPAAAISLPATPLHGAPSLPKGGNAAQATGRLLAAAGAPSSRGLPDPATAPAQGASAPDAANTADPTQAAPADVANAPASGLPSMPARVDADAVAAQPPGGDSLATAARAEANVTTRRIAQAAQQAIAQAAMQQSAVVARGQAATHLNVAFRSWGTDASGATHGVRVRLQDGQASVQPTTARAGQALASAPAFDGNLHVALEDAPTATDERRRRRGQQQAS